MKRNETKRNGKDRQLEKHNYWSRVYVSLPAHCAHSWTTVFNVAFCKAKPKVCVKPKDIGMV